MYKNIGKKIKGFSYFLAWVIIAVSSFYAFYRVFLNGFSVENTIVSGCIILGGCILAIILSWFIYAFGEIAQKAQEQNENLETLILLVEDLPSKIKAQSNKKDEVPLTLIVTLMKFLHLSQTLQFPLLRFPKFLQHHQR